MSHQADYLPQLGVVHDIPSEVSGMKGLRRTDIYTVSLLYQVAAADPEN